MINNERETRRRVGEKERGRERKSQIKGDKIIATGSGRKSKHEQGKTMLVTKTGEKSNKENWTSL